MLWFSRVWHSLADPGFEGFAVIHPCVKVHGLDALKDPLRVYGDRQESDQHLPCLTRRVVALEQHVPENRLESDGNER